MLRLLPRAFAMAGLAALISACSSAPDWTKPGTWIDNAAGGGAESGSEAKTAAPPPPSAGDRPTVPPATQTAGTATTDETSQPVENPLDPASAKPKPKVLPSQQAAGRPTEFPNLANQQDVQTVGTSESQRREIRDSLVADRDKAQHSADVLRGGTATPAAPPAPAAPAKPADDKPAEGSASTPAPTN